MKKGIHPKLYKNVSVLYNGKPVMNVTSTVEEISTEIWSGNHPFYTGQETLVDTDSLVDKFNKKLQKASTAVVSKKAKREKRTARRQTTSSSPVTLKDMLQNIK